MKQSTFKINLFTCVCVCTYAHQYVCRCQKTLVKVASLLLPRGFWEFNSSPKAWQQEPVCTESIQWP